MDDLHSNAFTPNLIDPGQRGSKAWVVSEAAKVLCAVSAISAVQSKAQPPAAAQASHLFRALA
jgi:hypothetical protein